MSITTLLLVLAGTVVTAITLGVTIVVRAIHHTHDMLATNASYMRRRFDAHAEILAALAEQHGTALPSHPEPPDTRRKRHLSIVPALAVPAGALAAVARTARSHPRATAATLGAGLAATAGGAILAYSGAPGQPGHHAGAGPKTPTAYTLPAAPIAAPPSSPTASPRPPMAPPGSATPIAHFPAPSASATLPRRPSRSPSATAPAVTVTIVESPAGPTASPSTCLAAVDLSPLLTVCVP